MAKIIDGLINKNPKTAEIIEKNLDKVVAFQLKKWQWIVSINQSLKTARELAPSSMVESDDLMKWDGIVDIPILDQDQWQYRVDGFCLHPFQAIALAERLKFTIAPTKDGGFRVTRDHALVAEAAKIPVAIFLLTTNLFDESLTEDEKAAVLKICK